MGKHRLKVTVIIAGIATLVVVNPLDAPHNYSIAHKEWTVQDSKSYAYDRLGVWRDKQMSCLSKLWGKESAWNPKAYNKIVVQGRNAGGIPQLLGLDPDVTPTKQIERGLDYIYHRYGTPCRAWKFFKQNNWH